MKAKKAWAKRLRLGSTGLSIGCVLIDGYLENTKQVEERDVSPFFNVMGWGSPSSTQAMGHQERGLYVDMRFFDMVHSEHAFKNKLHVDIMAPFVMHFECQHVDNDTC